MVTTPRLVLALGAFLLVWLAPSGLAEQPKGRCVELQNKIKATQAEVGRLLFKSDAVEEAAEKHLVKLRDEGLAEGGNDCSVCKSAVQDRCNYDHDSTIGVEDPTLLESVCLRAFENKTCFAKLNADEKETTQKCWMVANYDRISKIRNNVASARFALKNAKGRLAEAKQNHQLTCVAAKKPASSKRLYRAGGEDSGRPRGSSAR